MDAISNNRNDIADLFCSNCWRYFTVYYNREDMLDWLTGTLPIQDAMPYLTAGERELFL